MYEGHQGLAPIHPGDERTGKAVLDAAFRVHEALGPGMLESVYEHCLVEELDAQERFVERQVPVAVSYRSVRLPIGFRIDLLIDRSIIVEVKAVEALAPVHTAQVLTYLRFAERRLGYLLNFHSARLKDGIRRVVL